VKDEYLEEIEGDMGEIFQENLSTISSSKAKRLYAWETFKLLRPILLKKMEGGYRPNNFDMLKNYIKIALRNIKKHKAYSFINVFGLALGIAASSLILLWVQDELSYDHYHNNLDKIHKVVLNVEGDWWTSSNWALSPLLKQQYEEVEKATRYAYRSRLLKYKESSFSADVYL